MQLQLVMSTLLFLRGARAFMGRSALLRAPSARGMSSSGSFELEGVISKIGDVQTFESGFNKIEFVVTTDEMYPQEVKFARPRRPSRRVASVARGPSVVDVRRARP